MINKIIHLKRHWLVAGSAWICRVALIGIRFLLISLLLGYLGIERYAAFSVIISFEGWFFLCDFGLGPSVQNFLSEARAQGSTTCLLMRSIMQLVFILFCLFLILILCVGPLLSDYIFSNHQYVQAFQVAGIFYGVTAMGTIAYRVLLALQKGYLSYFLQLAASLVGLGALWVMTKNYSGSERLLGSLFCTVGIPALGSALVFLKVFPVRELFYKPDFVEIKRVALRASHFFGFGLINTAILSIDYLVMIRVLQSEDIVLYNIFSRVFLALFSLYALFLHAVWPLCSELMTLSRLKEVESLIKRYCLYGILFISLMTGGVMLFSSAVIKLFSLEQSVCISLSTIGLFGVYYVVRVICDSYSMLLQSMSHLKIFFIIGPIQALISYEAQRFFSVKYGLNGIVLGLICAFACTALWALPLSVYRKLKKGYASIPKLPLGLK